MSCEAAREAGSGASLGVTVVAPGDTEERLLPRGIPYLELDLQEAPTKQKHDNVVVGVVAVVVMVVTYGIVGVSAAVGVGVVVVAVGVGVVAGGGVVVGCWVPGVVVWWSLW